MPMKEQKARDSARKKHVAAIKKIDAADAKYKKDMKKGKSMKKDEMDYAKGDKKRAAPKATRKKKGNPY